jgi:hypothetical protein
MEKDNRMQKGKRENEKLQPKTVCDMYQRIGEGDKNSFS